MRKVELSGYQNPLSPGASRFKQVCWYFVNVIFFINPLNPFIFPKLFWLRWFGAKVGRGVVIKPSVNIKYPWKLTIGDSVWIGEKVWIDNLAAVALEDNVCLSQGAILLCGNHNYKSVHFDLRAEPIHLEEGVWIGAGAVVTGGVTCRSHSVLTISSVATRDLEAYGIYQGNPAVKIRERVIQ